MGLAVSLREMNHDEPKMTSAAQLPVTLSLFNIAMANGPVILDFPSKTSIYKWVFHGYVKSPDGLFGSTGLIVVLFLKTGSQGWTQPAGSNLATLVHQEGLKGDGADVEAEGASLGYVKPCSLRKAMNIGIHNHL